MFHVVTHKMLFRSLMNMINWTKSFQTKYNFFKKELSSLAWAKEYCTVKFGVSRQSGHSTFAIKLIEKFNNPVLFLPNRRMFYTIYKDCAIKEKNVGTVGFNPTQFRCLKGVDAVIVDCHSLFPKNEIDRIYETFIKNNFLDDQFIFIFLE